MDRLRQAIYQQVQAVEPFDAAEAKERDEISHWLQSDAPIFRIQKPANPRKHLVSYFALYDPAARKVLLIEHNRAKTWLINGGHVDMDEDPRDAARRECMEELGVSALFWQDKPEPLFVSATQTINESPEATHTDICLWYVLEGQVSMPLRWDQSEFSNVTWTEVSEVAENGTYFEPLRRFCTKLRAQGT